MSVAAPVAAQSGYGYVPAVRTHSERFLMRPFRIPLEALLEVKTPAELASRSLGETPRFASAPVASKPTDPFAASLAGSTAESANSKAVGAADPFEGSTPSAADPFAGSEPNADPFSGGASDADPFEASDDDPFDAGDSDPFN